MNKEKGLPFISIKWETTIDSFARHILKTNSLAQEFREIANNSKKFHSKDGKRINDELSNMEDIFLGRKPMLREGRFIMGPGMIGEINLRIPSKRFRFSDSLKK